MGRCPKAPGKGATSREASRANGEVHSLSQLHRIEYALSDSDDERSPWTASGAQPSAQPTAITPSLPTATEEEEELLLGHELEQI